MTNENELRPNYYKAQITGLDKDGKRVAVEVQPFDIIDALKLGFYAGNVLKYLWRMGRKHDDRLDDAKKVVTYAQQVLRCEAEDGPQINAVMVDHTQVRIIGRVDQPLPNDTYALRLAKEAAQLRDLLDIVTRAHKLLDDALIPRHTGGGGSVQEKTLLERLQALLAKDEPSTWGCGVTGSSRQALCAQNGCGFCRAAEHKMGNRTDFDAADERARRQGDSDVDMTIPSSSKKVTE